MTQTKINWGVLGTGNIVNKAGRGILQSSQGVWHGVAGRHRHNSEACAEKFQVPVAYDNYEQLLADPKIDAVYIALLTHLHVEWAVKACQAGKHVLVEKPLALDETGANKIHQAALQNGVCAAEAFVWTYHPAYAALKSKVQQGAIGELVLVDAHFSFSAYPESTRWVKQWGGGALYDVGCYPVSWSRYFMDGEPEAVQANMVVHPQHGVDQRFFGTLQYSGGRVAQISSALDMKLGSSFELLGTEDRISVQMQITPETMTIIATQADKVESWTSDRIDMFAWQADHFVERIREGIPGIVDGSMDQARTIGALMQSANEHSSLISIV